jgi:anti-sigma B factor antagonist
VQAVGRRTVGVLSRGSAFGVHRVETVHKSLPVSQDDFRIDVEREPGRIRVRPVGELDLATVPALEQELARVRDSATRCVVLDLRGLTFMDSTGLSLALRWSLEASRDGFDFSLVRGEGAVRRLFELTGMDGRLPFQDAEG